MNITNLMIVGLGGFAGSILRFYLSLAFVRTTSGFPFPTLVINVLGSFLLGLIVCIWVGEEGNDARLRLFLGTGFCGGFTTFSTFSVENLTLLQRGDVGQFLIYAVGSSVAGLGAAALGYWLGRLA